jgi:hypothetical protein
MADALQLAAAIPSGCHLFQSQLPNFPKITFETPQ